MVFTDSGVGGKGRTPVASLVLEEYIAGLWANWPHLYRVT